MYLHSLNFICHGIKSSEILLDQDFNVTLGNFEPQKKEVAPTTIVFDTLGHLDPYYVTTGNWSVKSDIYGFGMLLLETLTGLRIINIERLKELANLITSSSQFLEKERELKKIMDPRLQNNYSKEGAFECIVVALECLAKTPMDRPSSEEVLGSLEKIYSIHK
ncbi:putative serine/threonine-protein kinase PBL15 [Bidens hawaiensis]|uniref:putative serine/threonine-protein kinase PBL15 n=1 Tax=Bidens hawaiensis TaxID=980011 RepID=UPI00404A01FB